MIQETELLRVFAFVGVVATVYAFALVLLARKLLAKKPLRAFGRTMLALAVLGLGCMAYGRFVEPGWIEVTHTRVVTSHLPAGHRGVRVVHLSDIHSDPEPLLETRLPAIVAPLKPDLIVFTGDCANSDEGLPVFRACLTELAKIAPTFAVGGNWDSLQDSEYFGGTGATGLYESSAAIEVEGAKVRIVGAAFRSGEEALGRALAALEGDGLTIALFHTPYPDVIPENLASRVDLMCSGHVHGGQVALPLYGALLTLSKHGKRFERGFYPTADGFGFPLYVSRGIGMEGGAAPRVRFCSRPEVALIELAR